jgi:hypothetical protein
LQKDPILSAERSSKFLSAEKSDFICRKILIYLQKDFFPIKKWQGNMYNMYVSISMYVLYMYVVMQIDVLADDEWNWLQEALKGKGKGRRGGE